MTTRTSIRRRLAVLFGASFLVAGLILVALNYFLVDAEIQDLPQGGRQAFADEFGLEQKITIGPMSGRSNVTFWLEKREIEAS